jgi:hypothetical protein
MAQSSITKAEPRHNVRVIALCLVSRRYLTVRENIEILVALVTNGDQWLVP